MYALRKGVWSHTVKVCMGVECFSPCVKYLSIKGLKFFIEILMTFNQNRRSILYIHACRIPYPSCSYQLVSEFMKVVDMTIFSPLDLLQILNYIMYMYMCIVTKL